MNDSLLSTVVGSVRQQRLRLGWTQRDVAARAGMSRSTYARFERSVAITFPQFARVLDVLGLALTVGPATTGAVPIPEPGATRIRQRGIRHVRSAPSPATPPRKRSPAAPASPSAASATPTASPRAAAPPTTPSQSPGPVMSSNAAPSANPLPASSAGARPDAAAVARTAKAHANAIAILIRTIVMNGLTNYTARQVIRNVMTNERGLAEADWPAFLEALQSQLNGLNAENIAANSVAMPDFERWSRSWKRDLGFVDVIAPTPGQ